MCQVETVCRIAYKFYIFLLQTFIFPFGRVRTGIVVVQDDMTFTVILTRRFARAPLLLIFAHPDRTIRSIAALFRGRSNKLPVTMSHTELDASSLDLRYLVNRAHEPGGEPGRKIKIPFFFAHKDPRVKDWAMMSSPWPTVAACVCYAYCARVLGPHLMRNRKPFEMRTVLVLYNLAQTLFSAWIFYEYLMSGWWGHYDFRCQLVDYSRSPMAMRSYEISYKRTLTPPTTHYNYMAISPTVGLYHQMANTCWWYYFSKFTEFMDTLFFVLRKKNEHVSTLHVIHHGIMPFSVWMGMKFAPGGHSTFFALLNTFVHIVMYFYYMVSAMGPKYQKYIWWKKYLTAFQMVQFVLIFSHQLQVLFRPSCQYPRVFVYWIAMHGFLFLFLFSDFYKARYNKHPKAKASANGEFSNGLCMTVMQDDSKSLNGKNGYRQEEESEVPSSYASSAADAFVRRRPQP
ncbi:Elongation of very long chain fatty acids protein AAEL008004 [Eumeta japonica]|uniref:Elongation of very long chain fatty acids protein n=1 Tax=Eumeta variegata TaxID=151549 RepID=A0A4C1YMF4_EUMVA|nr:Elongation of very long chain fatty acids protein AAEL008004 [Eumeta japonica]